MTTQRPLISNLADKGAGSTDPFGAGFLDPRVYRSEQIFETEMRDVLTRCWIYIADTEELAEPGSYVADYVGYEPVVVLRDHDEELRAFSNVCRHRGCELLESGPGRCGKSIVCPYHGWRYQLDGALTGVPFRSRFETDLRTERLGMIPIKVDVWERFIFVNVSGDAPPLLEYLEELPTILADRDIRNAQATNELDDIVDINWKILVENGMEDYHLPFAHSGTLGRLLDTKAFNSYAWKNTGLVVAPTNYLTDTEEHEERDDWKVGYAFSIFPNLLISAWPGSLTALWWNPMTVTRTRARARNYTNDPSTDPRGGQEGRALMRQVQDEDFEVCGRVQRGLRSRLYKPGPCHHLELRVAAFQNRLAEMMAEAGHSIR